MEFPSLPSDSIHKTFFFGGLVVLIYLFWSTVIKDDIRKHNADSYQKEINESDKRQFQDSLKIESLKITYRHQESSGNITNGQILLPSTVLASSIPPMQQLNGPATTKRLYQMGTTLSLADAARGAIFIPPGAIQYPKHILDSIEDLTKDLQNEIVSSKKRADSIYSIYRPLADNLGNEKSLSIFLFFISFVIMLVGLNNWFRIQSVQDKILLQQYREKLGDNIPCQSCGMLLKYDVNYKAGDKFCHVCFDGINFTSPDLTLPELEDQIRGKLRQRGVSKGKMNEHVKILKNLDRWNTDFRW